MKSTKNQLLSTKFSTHRKKKDHLVIRFVPANKDTILKNLVVVFYSATNGKRFRQKQKSNWTMLLQSVCSNTKTK